MHSIYYETSPTRKNYISTHFVELFNFLPIDSRQTVNPGDAEKTLYALRLQNHNRMSRQLTTAAKDGIFVYDGLDGDAWKRIADRGGALVLDLSTEVFYNRADLVRGLHDGIAEAGLDPERVLLINNNMKSLHAYEHHRAALGLPRGPRIIPFNTCYWLVRGHNAATSDEVAQLTHRLNTAREAAQLNEKPYKFVSFNGRTRPHRLYALLKIFADGLFKEALISFLGHENHEGTNVESLTRMLKKRYPDAASLLPYIGEFADLLPLTIDVTRDDARTAGAYKNTLPWASPSPEAYDQSYFSVVIDTSIQDDLLFLTPIAFKSFMNLSPFVYIGNPGGLQELKRLGFMTFHPLIDESYDQEPDEYRRLSLCHAEIKRLCLLSPKKLREMYLELWPVLEHNYRLIHNPDRSQLLREAETEIFAGI